MRRFRPKRRNPDLAAAAPALVVLPSIAMENLVLGLGIFFVGLQLIGDSMRRLASSGLANALGGRDPSTFMGVVVGSVFGALLQSATAVSFILASLVRNGVMTEAGALPIILFSNVGLTSLAFLTTLNIHPLVAYGVGFSGIAWGMIKGGPVRPIAGVLLAVGLILYGLQTMSSGAAALNQTPWLQAGLHAAQANAWVGFFGGFLLAAILQSNAGSTMLVITLAAAGSIPTDAAIPLIYGSNMGAIPLRVLLSLRLHGPSFRIVRLEDLFCVWSGFLMLALFEIERMGVPLVLASLDAISSDTRTQLALAFLASNLLPAATMLIAKKPTLHLLKKIWPGDYPSTPGTPLYITHSSPDDANIAIALTRKEMRHLFDFVQLETKGRPDAGVARDETTPTAAFETLSMAIEDFIARIPTQETRSHSQMIELHRVRSELGLVRHIEEAVRNLSWTLTEGLCGADPASAALCTKASTIANELLKRTAEIFPKPTAEALAKLREDTRSDSAFLSSLRSALAGHPGERTHSCVSALSEDFEIFVWIVHRVTKVIQRWSGPGDSRAG